MPATSTSRAPGPACETCRRRSRKCDRERPQCSRCLTKGLVCEGYPTQFKILGLDTGPKAFKSNNTQKRKRAPPKPKKRSSNSNSNTESGSKLPPSKKFNVAPIPPPASGSSPHQGGPSIFQTTTTPPITSFSSPPANSQCSSSSPSSASFASFTRSTQLDHILAQEQTWTRLNHFENSLCEILSVHTTMTTNPFRDHIIPLANQHSGLLHAVLGLSACHMINSGIDNTPKAHTAALEHRLSAIQELGALLLKEECFGLEDTEEVLSLAIVLILVLHDICESGKSFHGAHLNGVAFLCARIVAGPTTPSPTKTFLLAALSWLDILRGFTGAEKLAFAPSVRDFVYFADGFPLETAVGCPAELFRTVGLVLESGKAYRAQELSTDDFVADLEDAEERMRKWDVDQNVYPTQDPEWKLLADAYRHVCLLRILRFPNPFQTPCTDTRIVESVESILDDCAKMPWSSSMYKRLLFPLFMAGADTVSVHRQHYVKICIAEILDKTKFPQPAVMEILDAVWQARSSLEVESPLAQQEQGNVPWMEFTCSTSLKKQHDYLFF
ncbi:uncharacterized protein PV06_01348 [Exophiala oligosperma]|uniref:Zn(2)-C6 fungal-type domain-containing protein n=1 Tax=Exophiala oligosperma TaxID=215243 RepID=A0A0D2E052_9EURO|nr:uncharacterized protein PV06_01348 [Exophiala oligosperma]KIW48783.1 hypothetical protein PV06_01348 [Exophiala oligosperma]